MGRDLRVKGICRLDQWGLLQQRPALVGWDLDPLWGVGCRQMRGLGFLEQAVKA